MRNVTQPDSVTHKASKNSEMEEIWRLNKLHVSGSCKVQRCAVQIQLYFAESVTTVDFLRITPSYGSLGLPPLKSFLGDIHYTEDLLLRSKSKLFKLKINNLLK